MKKEWFEGKIIGIICSKYMKTIIAFANTQGGKLIVGVDDKTHQIGARIVGVENEILFEKSHTAFLVL